jgi:hypothetical protein
LAGLSRDVFTNTTALLFPVPVGRYCQMLPILVVKHTQRAWATIQLKAKQK